MYDYDETIHIWVNTAPPDGEKKKKAKPKKKKYKHRVHSVAATLPEEFRIIRHFPSDLLEGMLPLNSRPGNLREGDRYTKQRAEEMKINEDGFLWPEEEKLVHDVICNHEFVFAWDENNISGKIISNW
jgi:hypothetical protein